MCSPVAAISTGLQIAGTYMGQKSMAANAQAQMDSQRTAAIKEMNYRFQNFEQERIDAFDAAVNELDKITHQAMELNSNVQVAVNEGMMNGGNTARAIERQVQGDLARAKTSIKDNYGRRSNEIDLNKEGALLSTKDFIQNLNNNAPKMPSAFNNFLTTAGITLNGYTAGQNERQSRINAGINDGRAGTGSVGGASGNWAGNNVGSYSGIDTNFGYSDKSYVFKAKGGLNFDKWYQ